MFYGLCHLCYNAMLSIPMQLACMVYAEPKFVLLAKLLYNSNFLSVHLKSYGGNVIFSVPIQDKCLNFVVKILLTN